MQSEENGLCVYIQYIEESVRRKTHNLPTAMRKRWRGVTTAAKGPMISDNRAVSMTFYSQRGGCYVEGRDLKVDEVMREWQNKYCTFDDVKICVSTFNVNGKSPPSIIPTWFSSEPNDICDFYAIGLQEMDLSVGTYIIDNTKKMDEWIDTIKSSLPGGRSQYHVITSMRLVGIFVIVLRSLKATKFQVSQVYTDYVATGISVLMNKLGNKGGTAISMKINDTFVCFVNSHFAAGTSELERRNQDFRDIYNQITFKGPKVSIYDHDVVFWFGDLNYRLNSDSAGLTGDDVRRVATGGQFDSLLKLCQLKEQMQISDIFKGFNEPEVFKFRPTYKYDVGTSNWDTSEKGRVPAWTDRILTFKKYPAINLDLVKPMESVETISISDHKPVRALFKLNIKSIDEKKANKLYEEAIREADRRANDELPQIQLSVTEIDFGDVNYLDPRTKFITVQNTGKSTVRFQFRITPAGQTICANWLQVTPTHYDIPEGNSMQISITVSINTKTVRDFNGNNPVLQDILVLHLQNGRDYFIPVVAKYNKKVFGNSLDELLRNKPQKTENLIDFGDDSFDSSIDDCPKDVPKEIYRLVNALRHRGPGQLNMSDHSDNAIFTKIRIALETGEPSDLSNFASSFMLYSALIRLLDTLEDPIIPSGMEGMIHYEFISHARDARALWKTAESFLPKGNRSVLELVCLMLREFISQNYSFRDQLPLWSQILFRYPPQVVNLQTSLDPRVVALQTLCEYGRDALGMSWLLKKVNDAKSQIQQSFKEATENVDADPKTNNIEAEEKTDESAEKSKTSMASIIGGLKIGGNVASTKLFEYANYGTEKLKEVKQAVIENTLIGDLNKEQNEFEKQLKDEKEKDNEYELPWNGLPDEVSAKKQIMNLSMDTRNFLRDSPANSEYTYDQQQAMAAILIKEDPNLAKVRFQLVPKQIKENKFWQNYFYRVGLIRQSILAQKDRQTPEPSVSGNEKEEKEKIEENAIVEQPKENVEAAKNTNAEDTQEENKKDDEKETDVDQNPITTEQPTGGTENTITSADEEWEKEILADLNDYEDVVEKTGGKDDDAWEAEIQELLLSE
ncbi:unnamed protein product [Caenorhabditis angaria]|uniref:BSD domain-containing protein n=1 Tax=Caenorhabditis angaria TaxID=860376 RepID=A0A9P1I3W5_9PELO|nr:unnamed protein product [Caenorhabditis angaria]